MFLVSSCSLSFCYILTPGISENEDVVGAAPEGDAPTTYEWVTILIPTKVHLILEVYSNPYSWTIVTHLMALAF